MQTTIKVQTASNPAVHTADNGNFEAGGIVVNHATMGDVTSPAFWRNLDSATLASAISMAEGEVLNRSPEARGESLLRRHMASEGYRISGQTLAASKSGEAALFAAAGEALRMVTSALEALLESYSVEITQQLPPVARAEGFVIMTTRYKGGNVVVRANVASGVYQMQLNGSGTLPKGDFIAATPEGLIEAFAKLVAAGHMAKAGA